MQPKFDLMRRALAVIKAIPDNVINLDSIRQVTRCGTLCCAAGWLAQDPGFNALGLRLPSRDGTIGGRLVFDDTDMWWERALGYLFNIDNDLAQELFAPRAEFDRSERDFRGTDKVLWMRRMRDYLAKHGELAD